MKSVSIPYRYKQNALVPPLEAVKLSGFQSPIGTNKTL